MVGHWIVFGLILAAIVPGWISLYRLATKNHKPTKKEKVAFGQNMIVGTFFIILADCFYMTCFNRWDIASYVLGILLTLIVFYNLWNVFVSARPRSGLEKWSSLLDFVVGIGVSVYLIYITQDQSLQNILIAMVAAVYGGMLTLAGVVLTIRKSDRDREEEEKKRAKPVFTFNMFTEEPVKPEFTKACFPMLEEEGGYPCEAYVEVENSNLSSFTMKKIKHDGRWFELEGNTTLIPGNQCVLSFRFESPFKIFLEAEDSLEIAHFYSMKVLSCPIKTTSGRFFHTLREIKETTVTEAEKPLEEAKKDA